MALPVLALPAASGPAQAVMHERIGRTFDGTAANGVVLFTEFIVAHALLIGAKVVGSFTHPVRVARLASVHLVEQAHDLCHLPVPQQIQLALGPLLGGEHLRFDIDFSS